MPGRYRFSFPPRRGHTDPWFRVGSLDITTTVLVTAMCVVSLFVWSASVDAWSHTALVASEVRRGQIWRVFTWPITNDLSGNQAIWNVVSIALFWYFGKEIERQIGRIKFAWTLVLITVIAGLVASGLNVNLWSIHQIEVALFVVFVAQYPKAPFFFGIPAWIIALVFVGIEILQYNADGNYELIIVLLVSIATAVWAVRSFGMLHELHWLPPIKLGRARAGEKPRHRPSKGTSGSGVVIDGGWPAPAASTPMHDQAELDRILDKIAAAGMDGLTSAEKKRLNELSKRLRKKGN
ncbi:unannotated protein [freshwater metagenome]|uniref:Unannotated protein n=1 Tax=freshwater metagenome TaxID=449393 RepID=A0A6J7F8H0_9ZZZZ|nr:hypothetical protein [Actinomycetota bacterium]